MRDNGQSVKMVEVEHLGRSSQHHPINKDHFNNFHKSEIVCPSGISQIANPSSEEKLILSNSPAPFNPTSQLFPAFFALMIFTPVSTISISSLNSILFSLQSSLNTCSAFSIPRIGLWLYVSHNLVNSVKIFSPSLDFMWNPWLYFTFNTTTGTTSSSFSLIWIIHTQGRLKLCDLLTLDWNTTLILLMYRTPSTPEFSLCRYFALQLLT